MHVGTSDTFNKQEPFDALLPRLACKADVHSIEVIIIIIIIIIVTSPAAGGCGDACIVRLENYERSNQIEL